MTLNELRKIAPIGKKVETLEKDFFSEITKVNSFEEINAIEKRKDFFPEDYFSEYPFDNNDFSRGFPMYYHWLRIENHKIIVKGYAIFDNDENVGLIGKDDKIYWLKEEK